MKGLMVMSILLAHPKKGERILDLPKAEGDKLRKVLLNHPQRLFSSTDRVKNAFIRLFALYDSNDRGKVLQRIEMRCAALELLLAVAEASARAPA